MSMLYQPIDIEELTNGTDSLVYPSTDVDYVIKLYGPLINNLKWASQFFKTTKTVGEVLTDLSEITNDLFEKSPHFLGRIRCYCSEDINVYVSVVPQYIVDSLDSLLAVRNIEGLTVSQVLEMPKYKVLKALDENSNLIPFIERMFDCNCSNCTKDQFKTLFSSKIPEALRNLMIPDKLNMHYQTIGQINTKLQLINNDIHLIVTDPFSSVYDYLAFKKEP